MRNDTEIRKCNIRVTPKNRNEDIKETMRRFRKLTEKEGIIKEIKKHAYFEKPSDVRRRARLRAIRRAKLDEELRKILRRLRKTKMPAGPEKEQMGSGSREVVKNCVHCDRHHLNVISA